MWPSLTKSPECLFPYFFHPNTTVTLSEAWRRAVRCSAAPQQTLLVEEPVHTSTLMPTAESCVRSSSAPESLSQPVPAQHPFLPTATRTQLHARSFVFIQAQCPGPDTLPLPRIAHHCAAALCLRAASHERTNACSGQGPFLYFLTVLREVQVGLQLCSL